MKNRRNVNAPPNADLVQTYLQSSWDIVTAVYNSLGDIQELADALLAGDLVGYLQIVDIDTIAELNAILTDATLGDFASQAEAEAGTSNVKTMTPLRVAQAIAVLAAGLLNKYDGTVPPGATDDDVAGYSVGSYWIDIVADPDESYRCTDNSTGAAVWIKTTLTSDELAAVALSGDSDDLVEGVVQLLMTVAERSRLAAIEDNATADQTGAEIKTAYELEANTNAFTDTEKTQLGTVESGATADQTDGEIKTAYQTEVPLISQVDAEAGTATVIQSWSALRVAQAIAALAAAGSPLTTKGDLFGFSTADARLPVGTNGQVLTADSAEALGIKWAAVAGGGGGLTVEFKTASFTAEAGKKYLVDSSGGPVVVTLPAGTNLDNIIIADIGHAAAVNNITVNPNGAETINGDTTFVIDQNDGDIDIGYQTSSTDWQVSADGGSAAIVGVKVRTIQTLIETIDNSGTAGDFLFSGIPAGYDRLIIRGELRGDVAGTLENLYAFLNADTTVANYNSQHIHGYNATAYATETASPIIAYIGASGSPSNDFAQITVVIENPNSGHNKQVQCNYIANIAANAQRSGQAAVTSVITAAVNQIQILTDNDPTDELFGTLSLYGELDEAIGDGTAIVGPAKTRTVRTALETIDNVTAGEFDFNNIPAGYDRLIIKGNLRGDDAVVIETVYLFLNADTTAANYRNQNNGGLNGTASITESATPRIAFCPGASSSANDYSQLSVAIEDPNGTYKKTALGTCHFRQDSGSMFSGHAGVTSVVAAAITRLRFRTDNHATDQLLGTLTLYGEKDEEIGGGAGFEDVTAETGTTYEFTALDLVDAKTASNAAASIYDIPDGLGSKGSTLTVVNIGAGVVTITVAGSDTLGTSDNKCAQWKAVTMLKHTATEWLVIGGSA